MSGANSRKRPHSSISVSSPPVLSLTSSSVSSSVVSSSSPFSCRFAAFKQMLYDRDVPINSTFHSSLPLFISDPRFALLRSPAERESAFSDWLAEAPVHLAHHQQQRIINHSNIIRDALRSWPSLSSHSTLPQIECYLLSFPVFPDSPRLSWLAIDSANRSAIIQQEKQRRQRDIQDKIEQRKGDFLSLLRQKYSSSLVSSSAAFSSSGALSEEIERKMSREPSFLALNERERREVFTRFLVELEIEKEEKERERFLEEESKLKEEFVELMEEMSERGLIHPGAKWEHIQKILEGNVESGAVAKTRKSPIAEGKLGKPDSEIPPSQPSQSLSSLAPSDDLEEGELPIPTSSVADLTSPLSVGSDFAHDSRYENLRDYAEFQSKLGRIKRWHTDFTHFIRDFFLEYIDYQLGLFEDPDGEVDRLRELGEQRGIFANSHGKWHQYYQIMGNNISKTERERISEGIAEDFGFLIATAWIYQQENEKVERLRKEKEKEKENGKHERYS